MYLLPKQNVCQHSLSKPELLRRQFHLLQWQLMIVITMLIIVVTNEIVTITILVCWGYINKRLVEATRSFSPWVKEGSLQWDFEARFVKVKNELG